MKFKMVLSGSIVVETIKIYTNRDLRDTLPSNSLIVLGLGISPGNLFGYIYFHKAVVQKMGALPRLSKEAACT